METRKLIEDKVKKGIEKHDRNQIMVGLLNKCADNIYDAYRHLENGLQYCDDDNIRKTLEDIKMGLGHEIGISGDFDEIKPGIISKLQDLLNDFKGF